MVLDAKGGYVVPGLIDTHVCGTVGLDCRRGLEAIKGISASLVKYGVTSFLPTIIGTATSGILAWLPQVRQAQQDGTTGASILGAHLEGPYLGAKYRGLTMEEQLEMPSIERDRPIYEKHPGLVKLVTLAPELPNGLDYIRYLKEQNVVTAIGHSQIGTRTELDTAVQAGLGHVTHIFNAMQVRSLKESGVDSPGLADLAIIDDRLSVSLIADGVHVCPELIALLTQAKPHDRIVLITDCFMGTGLGKGRCTYPDGQEVVLDGSCHRTVEQGTLAGSVLTLNQAIKNVLAWTDTPLTDAVAMATINPARLIGNDSTKGALKPGMDADIAIFDRQWNPRTTLVAGEIVYQAKNKEC